MDPKYIFFINTIKSPLHAQRILYYYFKKYNTLDDTDYRPSYIGSYSETIDKAMQLYYYKDPYFREIYFFDFSKFADEKFKFLKIHEPMDISYIKKLEGEFNDFTEEELFIFTHESQVNDEQLTFDWKNNMANISQIEYMISRKIDQLYLDSNFSITKQKMIDYFNGYIETLKRQFIERNKPRYESQED